MASHYRLTGARHDLADLPAGHPDRAQHHPIDNPSFSVEQLTLEDLVLAYMTQAPRISQPALESTP